MAVVLLSTDLMGASRIEGAARLAGTELRLAADADAAIDACASQPTLLVIVDLATPGLDVASLVVRLRGRTERVPAIVAFGPHVHEASLEAARAAGCDEVLSRGQFLSQADAIIARHATAS